MMCYKYKKYVHGLIFNYNEIVSDLNIGTANPADWDCQSCEFCYQSAGHIVTNNFNIIKDKRIRHLFSKFPKYRLPTEIDFDACRAEIAEGLNVFANRWCKRESADKQSLSSWK